MLIFLKPKLVESNRVGDSTSVHSPTGKHTNVSLEKFKMQLLYSLNIIEGFNPLKDSRKFLYLNIHVLLLDIQGNGSIL